MYEFRGDGWHVSAQSHGQMLLALYVRDLAGIEHPGLPAIARLAPAVKPHAAAEFSGYHAAELRQEWQDWWHRILHHDEREETAFSPPGFAFFADSPTLQRLLRAHYGSALSWSRERLAEYSRVSAEHHATGRRRMLEQMITERALELEREPRPMQLKMVELPLAQRRAWFVDPGTVILSQDLPRDAELYRSFLEPVIRFML
ncbi:hypothetical protein [Arthrobacter sp. JSM 101049]|uniref:hypothetical protein n=1 Tax=Arthrobacter sp. JSM 101049 TaxID=929097 RepID=UPI003565EAC4